MPRGHKSQKIDFKIIFDLYLGLSHNIYSFNLIFRRRNDKKVKYTPSRKSTIALEDYMSGISMFVLLHVLPFLC